MPDRKMRFRPRTYVSVCCGSLLAAAFAVFFLAALPQGQAPLHASEEVAESLWIAPNEALSRFESGAFRMAPPTVMVLRTLAQHKTWHTLCSSFGLV